MKKILFTLLFGLIGLVSCTKTEYVEEYFYNYDTIYVEEYFYNYDTIYVDNHSIDTLFVNKNNSCLIEEILSAYRHEDIGFYDYENDSLYITDSEKYPNWNKLSLIHTLVLDFKPLVHDYKTGKTTYDTISYWGGNPSVIFNYLIRNKNYFDDVIECDNRYRVYKKNQWSDEELYKDTIINIHCPHRELIHKWYYSVYHK